MLEKEVYERCLKLKFISAYIASSDCSIKKKHGDMRTKQLKNRLLIVFLWSNCNLTGSIA